MERSQTPTDPSRVRVSEALARLAVGSHELPPPVLARLHHRARSPDARLLVGRYLIVGELGRGGMGLVYDAWDAGIERRVAIKTIEPDRVPEDERDEVVARFRREIKIVGQLNHPAIVTIFDFGQERVLDPMTGARLPSLFYYVMEYLEGQSLAHALRDRRRLPRHEAIAIAADVAEALHLAHRAGVVHRDIKPSNIFLREGTNAVLLDFGIAKLGDVALTQQGQILGTPSFLAPERLQEKEQPIDGRADIFSLGVLLYTMLDGEAPFVGSDAYEVINKITHQAHPTLGLSGGIGRRLSEVLDRMLAKQPENRYATGQEAARALRALQADLLPDEKDAPQQLEPAVLDPGSLTSTDLDPTPALLFDEEDPTPGARHPMAASDGHGGLPPFPSPTLSPSLLSPASPENGEGESQPIVDVDGDAAGLQTDRLAASISRLRPKLRPFAATNEADHTPVSPAIATPSSTTSGEGSASRSEGIAVLLTEEIDDDGTHIERMLRRPTRLVPTDDGAGSGETSDRRGAAVPKRIVSETAEVEALVETPRVTAQVGTYAKTYDSPAMSDQIVRPRGDVGLRRRSGRPAIEAELIDESQVHPLPLDTLKPDEAPTHADFNPPSPPAMPLHFVSAPVHPPDPAEKKRGPVPAADSPGLEARSAAVARRTFAAAPDRGTARSPTSVQVRMSGPGLSVDSGRLIKRRLMVLVAGGLASAAAGLLLGRMQQPSPSALSSPLAAESSPRVQARPASTSDDPALVPPRTPRELVLDADGLREAEQYDDALRLYDRALMALPATHALQATATYGKAETLRDLGRVSEALYAYRTLVRDHPKAAVADNARLVLRALEPQPAKFARRPETAAIVAKPDAPAALGPPAQMPPEDACRWILTRYIKDAQAAVSALEGLRSRSPSAPCIYWNLGRKYEALAQHHSALAAYRRFMDLDPTSLKAPAIRQRIIRLESKLADPSP